MIASDHGSFPFGRPNTARPLRSASSGTTKALIVGVYPSAFHVRWSPPAECDDRPVHERRRPFVASLAVDVEPTVFWDGTQAAELLERWKAAVKFKDAWGTLQLGHNGPSGDGLVSEYLAPLGLQPGDVAMTDAVPWYFVKGGPGSQGAAIARVNALAAKVGFETGRNLPPRPSTRRLVEIACGPERRDSLRKEMAESGAPLVITLGQEALDAVRGVADEVTGVQDQLAPGDGYGTQGSLVIGVHRLLLLPLAHPGLLRQAAEGSVWRSVHTAWAEHARAARDLA